MSVGYGYLYMGGTRQRLTYGRITRSWRVQLCLALSLQSGGSTILQSVQHLPPGEKMSRCAWHFEDDGAHQFTLCLKQDSICKGRGKETKNTRLPSRKDNGLYGGVRQGL